MAPGKSKGSPLIILLLGALTVAGLARYVRGLITGEKPAHVMTTPSTPAVAPLPPSGAPTRVADEPAAAPPSPRPSAGATRRAAQGLKAFRERFGEGITAEFGREGRLESARGRRGEGRRAGPGFDAHDPRKAIARAREVIDAAEGLLGVQPALPLETPLAHAGPSSAQVTFSERSGGVPLAPGGTVTVTLGAQGELLGISSSYLPDVRVVNERRLDSEAARAKAVDAVPDKSAAVAPMGGAPVIWVPKPAEGAAPEGRHAYEYSVQGRRVIVDASSGAILHRRDERQF